jgi:ArsR family transcriptional regulator, arsenate/arsenite/antimonite-responsive transcriptional repressor
VELNDAVRTLAALAQDARLRLFRTLVQAGPGGLAAGDLAQRLGVPPSTLSAQLTMLTNVGLIRPVRRGRSLIYAAEYDAVTGLLVYLTEDCCQGRPEVCAPLARSAAVAACAPARTSN